MNIKYFVGVCAVIICALFCQSCKKGCTHSTASNYLASAKVDDGSCLYCDSVGAIGSNNSISVFDNNSGSPFSGQNVANLSVSSTFIAYNGNGCKLLGHVNTSSSGCSMVNYTASMLNQTSSTMTFTGTIQIETFFDSTSFVTYNVSNITIPPGSATSLPLGNGGCQQPFGGFNLQLLSATFSYH